MTPRRTHRGSRGPGAARSRGTRRIRNSGGGGGKSSSCAFAVPAIAASLLVLLAQHLAVHLRTRHIGRAHMRDVIWASASRR